MFEREVKLFKRCFESNICGYLSGNLYTCMQFVCSFLSGGYFFHDRTFIGNNRFIMSRKIESRVYNYYERGRYVINFK